MASGRPASAGVTAGAARDTLVAEYDDLESAWELLRHGDVAALLVPWVDEMLSVVVASLHGEHSACCHS